MSIQRVPIPVVPYPNTGEIPPYFCPRCPIETDGVACHKPCAPSMDSRCFEMTCEEHLGALDHLKEEDVYTRFSPICTLCLMYEGDRSRQYCARKRGPDQTRQRLIYAGCPKHSKLLVDPCHTLPQGNVRGRVHRAQPPVVAPPPRVVPPPAAAPPLPAPISLQLPAVQRVTVRVPTGMTQPIAFLLPPHGDPRNIALEFIPAGDPNQSVQILFN